MNSTKGCYNCGNTYLLCLRTLNLKICTDCDTTIPWFLELNQKALFEDINDKDRQKNSKLQSSN